MEERIDVVLRHYRMLLGWKDERIAVREMRKHVGWYLHGLRGAAQMRAKINLIDDPAEAMRMLEDFCREQA